MSKHFGMSNKKNQSANSVYGKKSFIILRNTTNCKGKCSRDRYGVDGRCIQAFGRET
jgi:hypothetical protein